MIGARALLMASTLALAGCSLGSELAAAAVRELAVMLAEYRRTITVDQANSPEPCGGERLPTAFDRSAGSALIWLAKRTGCYYEADAWLCNMF